MAEERQNVNQNINQAIYGLNTDNILQQVKPGSLTYALNTQIESFDGNTITYQNEQSNVLCRDFKAGYRVIGFHSIIEQNRTIIFMVNPSTGDSEIGELNNNITCNVDNPTNLGHTSSNNYVNNGYNNLDCKSACTNSTNTEILTFYELYKKLNPQITSIVNSCCIYNTIINSRCLNFNINYPIYKAVHREVSIADDGVCGTEVYWGDGLNPRRFINLDNLPFSEDIADCDRIKSNEVDCDLLNVQPTIKLPCIYPKRVTDGGSLIAGTYEFAIAYSNDKGETYTSYYSINNPISIFQRRYGLDYNFPTDKSIKLLISNLDTKFRYFNLAVIKTINGVSDPEVVGVYDITGNNIEIVYSGNNKSQINLSIDDIFQKYPIYQVAGEVNTTGNLLMWANLKTDKRVNYQSIASAITLKWQTWQLPYNDNEGYNNGINTSLYKGYMRDEVYAFEFVPILKSGKQCDGFHIPGREAVDGDLETVTSNDIIISEPGSCETDDSIQYRWKVYNTGSVIAQDPAYIAAEDKTCYIGPFEYGEFSYWESDKKYPCNDKIWGDLAGKNIRHYKFPDNLITHIHDINNTPENINFEHKIYPIGIKIDMENIQQAIINSTLTDAEKLDIIGFRIVRSDRVNNKSVIAKGLLYNIGAYLPVSDGDPDTTQTIYYPNYPFNDLGTDPFLTDLASLNNSTFDISLVDVIEEAINNAQQQLDTLSSLLPQISAVAYTDNGGAHPPQPIVIQITNTELNDLKNKISIAEDAGNALIGELSRIQAYYNNKIQNGEQICQDDVTNLTIDSSLITTYFSDIDDVTTSSAMGDFQSAVDYVNANAGALDSHPDATAIFQLKDNLMQILLVNNNIAASETPITNAVDNYNTALTDLGDILCTDEVVQDSSFSANRFTFHSPDTHFYQPFLGTQLKFETVEGGVAVGNFVQVKDHAGSKLISSFSAGIALVAGIAVGALFAVEPKGHVISFVPGAIYTAYYPDFPSIGTIAEKSLFWNKQFKELIDSLIPYKNYAYQYNAVGYYNTYNPIPNEGNKQRSVAAAYYLLPGMQSVGDDSVINNWKRESSVYFRLPDNNIVFPNDESVKGELEDDDSRVSYSNKKQIFSNILSYYASHKRKLTDQYGDIYTYNTVDTGYCGLIDITKDYTEIFDSIFGGDVFINRFGLKRKLSYFIDTAVNRPDGSDINYSDLSNVGKVRYWYNTSSSQTPNSGFKGLMKSILGVPQSNLDGNTNKLFYQNGRIYLYSYGIAYFFTESEVNVDYRQAGNNVEKDFFPNVGSSIPNDWLQEVTVPIVNDNYYIYNKTYSKQLNENVFTHLPISFDPDDKCQEDFTHRVIYSDPNKWRIYKPISYFDFPKNYGKLTSIDTIDNTQVLVRFENKSYIYNALTTIQTSSGKYAYLGNDDVFRAQPIDFGETDLGYAGSQHHLLIKTEAGHLFIDAVRGSIFLIEGSKIDCISNYGIEKWFNKYLSFEISTYFPQVNIDNTYNNIGITGVWDNKYNRFLITKLDYIPQSQYASDITYDSRLGRFYYKNQEILLQDPKYFCNRSWTLSYSPDIKSWVSYHSYLPNYYISQNGLFLSGINGTFDNQSSSVWIHNLINTSYQIFYGKLEPYILEYPFVFKLQDEIVHSIKDYTTILEYYNSSDFYEINDGVYFNKAILSNGQQTSGLRNLYPKPKGKLNLYFNYPTFNSNSIDIIYTKSDNLFNYNSIWDVVKNPNNHNPIWIESCENRSVGKVLNNDKLDYTTRSHQKTKLRSKDMKVRHINDKFDRYKFISKFILNETQISYK